jgi:glycosyltransferase involved in cell wall biosynthesis
LFYAEFNIRLFLFLFFSKVDVLVANDLDTLPANYLVSVLRKKPLVYDTHEYFCGVPELQNRIFVKNIWRKIESTIFPKLTNIYTVNASIARLYEEEYGKNINVIRNVPVRIRKAGWPDRFALGLPRDKKIILLQGSGINMNRGAEEVLLALPHMENVVFLIVGGGDVIHLLKKMVVDEKLDQQVIFKPKMPYEEMMCYTRLADLGLSLDKDTNINYRYSLPNKVFDYIQAQIPVLCTNLVEVAAIVNTWQIGRVIDHLEPEYLAKTINEILADEHQVAVWKHNLENAANVLCWENEEHELIRIYSKFL